MKKKDQIYFSEDDLSISSPLREIKGLNSFSTPDGYFDQLEDDILMKTTALSKISFVLSQKFIYFAAAASIALVITFIGFRYLGEDTDNSLLVETVPVNSEIIVDTNSENTIIASDISNEQLKQQGEEPIDINRESILPKQIQEQKLQTNFPQIVNNNQAPQKLEADEPSKLKRQQATFQEDVKVIAQNPNSGFGQVNTGLQTGSILVSSKNKSVQTSLARIAANSNRILPKDTCVNKAFVYQLSSTFTSNTKNKFVWQNEISASKMNIDKSGKYILHYWIENMLEGIDTMNVILVKKPSPSLGNGMELCNHESVLLSSGMNEDNYSFKWSISSLNKAEIYITNLAVGAQLITLEVSSCIDTVLTEVLVQVNDCQIAIPNVITPNGDGYNDAFVIKGLEHYPGSSLTILNRNGKVVYQSADYNNDWKANNVEEGSYFYSLQLNDKNKTEKGGILSIVR